MHRSCTFQVFQMGSQTTWKAKWLIFKAIVAGFRGKVAQTNSTHGVPGRITPSLFRSFDLFFFFREIVFASIATRKRHSTSRALASHVACFGDLIHKNEGQSSKNQAHRRLWGCGPQQNKLLKSGTLMICLLTHLFLGFSAIKPKNFQRPLTKSP